ncbi:MAG: CYTH domain-containing protein [Bermanella sp.]
MANEVELKLTLPSFAAQDFLQDSQLGEYQGEPLLLDNQYFDTDDLKLNQGHAALRIRKSQHGYVQTLKNKGTALAGLHVRGEWEYDIASAHIDWSLFPQEVQFDDAIKQAIKPLFKTDFQRHVWHVQVANSHVELVMDQGLICAHDHNSPICEIELELKSGDAADLFTLALQLAARYPLVPCDISKAERGYALLYPTISFFTPSDFAAQMQSAQDFNVTPFLQETLQRISRRWDKVCSTENWWSLLVLSRQVQAMAWLVNQLPMMPVALQEGWQELSLDLLTLLEPASLVIALHVDHHSNSRGLSQRLMQLQDNELNECLKRFIDDNKLGQNMLQLGQFLYTHSQAVSFNEYLASALHNLEVSQWQENNEQQMQMLQGMAFLFKRLDHSAYQILNQFINQSLVVRAMTKAQTTLSSISDEDSRAKLGSWVRRLTVESRRLQDLRASLLQALRA